MCIRDRPRRTWLCTDELDLQPHDLGLNAALKRVQDRSEWRQLVETAMCSLKGAPPDDVDDDDDDDVDACGICCRAVSIHAFCVETTELITTN